jgi:S1-C subfamily serine protease
MKFVRIIVVVFSMASTSIGQPARDIARVAFKSVVLLEMNDSNGQPLSLGSGFFISSGIIATNAHVIEGASSGTAKLVGDTHTLQILGTVAVDRNADLALLKVDSSAPSLVLGPSTSPAVGDNVYVVGNPLGLEGTFSEGIISGVRHIDEDSILQMTAPISPGSSGGPVMDNSGGVIGISEATFTNGQNLNFAVPALYLSKLLASVSKQMSITPLEQSGQGDRSKTPMLDAVVKGDVQAHHLAKIEQQGEALYKNARYADAEPLLAQACTGGSVDACSYLGSMYEKGNGVIKDYSKALLSG